MSVVYYKYLNMNINNEILIEGFNDDEIKELLKTDDFIDIVFSDAPIIFKAGTSEILGQFTKEDDRLRILFSHITGGGEGVLIKLMNLFREFCKDNDIKEIIWTVHAVDCPRPNIKLPGLLERKGFKIVNDPIDGSVYRKQEEIICQPDNIS